MTNHPRYKEFQVYECGQRCHHFTENLFKAFLFKNEKKLRSHAVKHFLNLTETEWKNDLIGRAVSDLENIECPYMMKKPSEPPCVACRIYSECSAVISEIETAYCQEIEHFIQEACSLPRYACFYSKEWSGDEAVWLIPNRPLVIKSAHLKDGIYNAATCYSHSANIKMADFIDMQLKQLEREKERKSTPIFCTQDNWNIGDPIPQYEEKEKPQKKKKTLHHHHRGGAKNFRRYLEYSD